MDRESAQVFIVDDHPIVRRGLSEIISRERDLCVCGEAGSAEEAMQQIQQGKPDLVIVDISLDSVSGLELIRMVKEAHDDVKMLVASMHDERVYAERALHAGAHGYINKEEATDHLIGAIRQVLLGKVYLSDTMTNHLLERARDGDNHEQSAVETLTDREFEVFELFGEGLSTKEIAERLHRSVKTIESHRDRIRAKLQIETSNELIHRATLWVRDHRG